MNSRLRPEAHKPLKPTTRPWGPHISYLLDFFSLEVTVEFDVIFEFYLTLEFSKRDDIIVFWY